MFWFSVLRTVLLTCSVLPVALLIPLAVLMDTPFSEWAPQALLLAGVLLACGLAPDLKGFCLLPVRRSSGGSAAGCQRR
ncbi:hypothetical protein [Deinococcus multiflagellatus]|uniref:Uncharacterized protein n=1 Tax=Deinococcus multiflagellatus TaxID=1656887 RepID=A0ABW1ZPJ0_9DEIO|nr:hypothetical protein [Deinococcus multiflagellatus]MBZ9715639.1 hypothetical protein [Deinococcus multiflagellatus]